MVKYYPAKEFYDRLETIRNKNGWTRQEMGDRLGVTPQRYGVLSKTRRIRDTTAREWCERLGIEYIPPAADTASELESKLALTRELCDIYPAEFFRFLQSEEGYAIAMATFSNYARDSFSKKVAVKFQNGLETLRRKRTHHQTAAILGI